MNRQSGPIMIQATLGDITYYKRNGVFLVKRKSAVSRTRLKNSPQYAVFRQHQKDFSTAASGGKLIRYAFKDLVAPVADSYCVSRMTTHVLKVIQSDASNPVGERRILNGNLDLLTGFEFNAGCALDQVLLAPIKLSKDPANGIVSLDITSINPSRQIKSPKAASHFQVVFGWTSVDFSTGDYKSTFEESVWIPLDSTASTPLSLSCSLDNANTGTLILVVGLRFSQRINDVYEPVLNSEFQALKIVEVIKAGDFIQAEHGNDVGTNQEWIGMAETSRPDQKIKPVFSETNIQTNKLVPIQRDWFSGRHFKGNINMDSVPFYNSKSTTHRDLSFPLEPEIKLSG